MLYGRPECHLCDEARELLTGLVAEAGDVVMVERNIEEDDELHRRFLERIPVVELDGASSASSSRTLSGCAQPC